MLSKVRPLTPQLLEIMALDMIELQYSFEKCGRWVQTVCNQSSILSTTSRKDPKGWHHSGWGIAWPCCHLGGWFYSRVLSETGDYCSEDTDQKQATFPWSGIASKTKCHRRQADNVKRVGLAGSGMPLVMGETCRLGRTCLSPKEASGFARLLKRSQTSEFLSEISL